MFQNQFTAVELSTPPFQIQAQDKLVFMGSCFGQNMAQKLSNIGFSAAYSPFGVVFNPHSIAQQLQLLSSNDVPLFEHLSYYFSPHYHHLLKSQDKEQLIQQIETNKIQFNKQLQQSQVLYISLGSAWVYTHLPTQTIVANCHKLPQNLFAKSLLTHEQIIQSLQLIYTCVHAINPHIHLVFTVSPVKHLRDGAVQNNISKSRLISALHQFLEQNPQCHYFAAYELLSEELRDYRFYQPDLMHPSEWTVNYIYQRWLQTHFSPTAQDYVADLEKLYKLQNHIIMDSSLADIHHESIAQLESQINQKYNLTQNPH